MASMAMEPMTGNVSAKLFREGLCLENKTFDISFAGKTVIVTGSNTGIGLACAQILARLNVTRLIMAVRSIKKGEDAAAPIREAHPAVRIDVWDLDMSSYDSIQEFSMRCVALPKLDIAILNAGMSTGPVFKKDPNTGHEETIQVNYISTALLSILLLPALRPRNRTEPPGRLTIVGSGTGLTSSFENANAVPLLPSFDVPFSGIAAAAERYSLSKTLVMMLVAKLGEAVSADDVIVNTMQPGLTSGTGLHRDFSGPGKYAMGVLKKVSSRTPEQAAWTYIDAVAVKGKESHGSYIMFWEVAAFHQMMYTEEGKKTTQRLWDETIAELEFAGVKNVLRSMH